MTFHPYRLGLAAMLWLSAVPASAQTETARSVPAPAPPSTAAPSSVSLGNMEVPPDVTKPISTREIIIVGGRTARGGKAVRKAGIASLNPQPLPPEPRPAVETPAMPRS